MNPFMMMMPQAMPIPPTIQAAMSYLHYTLAVRNPSPMFEGHQPQAYELTDGEQKTQEEALKLLRAFFQVPG